MFNCNVKCRLMFSPPLNPLSIFWGERYPNSNCIIHIFIFKMFKRKKLIVKPKSICTIFIYVFIELTCVFTVCLNPSAMHFSGKYILHICYLNWTLTKECLWRRECWIKMTKSKVWVIDFTLWYFWGLFSMFRDVIFAPNLLIIVLVTV